MSTAAIAQLNVRLDRELKDRGDATLRLVGSSPAKIIRRLWECLASGGDAYERLMATMSPEADETIARSQCRVERSASLFKELGDSLGFDLATFTPDVRSEHEILEEIDWDLLVKKGLA